VEQQVQDGLAAPDEIAREALHVFERRVGRSQPAHADEAQCPEDAFRRVRPWRPRIGVLEARREAPVERGRDRHLEDTAAPGPRRAVVREEIRPERRLDEFGPALVRLVEQRRDAGFDEVALTLERRHMFRGEPEPP
jgi:hypothetical protein